MLEYKREVVEYDEKNVLLNIVSFLLPPIGLLLYLYFKKDNKYPQKASSIGRWALAGLGVWVVLILFSMYSASLLMS